MLLKKISWIGLISLMAAGCTANLNDRLRETLTVETGTFNKLKAKNMVRESLQFPTDEFSLSIQAADPIPTPKGELPLQFLKAQFIPVGERMIFASIDPIEEEIKPEFEFELLENGQVKVFGRNHVYFADEIPFVAADGVLASKPIEYVVTSKRSGTSASVLFTPVPLKKALEGKTLSIALNHPMLTRFQLTGTGYEPGSTVTLQLTSGPKKETIETIADEQGNISTELQPYVIGTLGGQAQIAAGDLALDFPWGTYLEKKTYEDKSIFPILFVINRQPADIDGLKIQKAFASYTFNKG
ncbi:MAG: hypothetical protein JSS32_02475 [Verrucomicrobia bacterium]|nr:hypothetical protein [Verrucomicrobiota bacterium]